MRSAIYIGTRLESLEALQEKLKIVKIYTEFKSKIDLFYKSRSKLEFYNKNNIDNILQKIYESKVDLVISVGLNFRIKKKLIDQKKIYINSHPSILPDYKGLHPIKDMIKDGQNIFGCTVHHINHKIDNGLIIAQKKINFSKLNVKDIHNYLFSKVEPLILLDSLKLIEFDKNINDKFFIGNEYTFFNKFLTQKKNNILNNFKYGQFTKSGRDGFYYFLEKYNIKDSIVYLPGFICKSLLDVVIKNKIKYIFYDIDKKIGSNIKLQRNSAILVIHYFGKKINIDRTYLKKNSITLIEDYTHLLSLNLFSESSIKRNIFLSIRKFSGSIYGGWFNHKLTINNHNGLNLLKNKKPINMIKRKDKYFESSILNNRLENSFVSEGKKHERYLTKNINYTALDKQSLNQFFLFDWINIQLIRKRNWLYLKKRLGNNFDIYQNNINSKIFPIFFVIFTNQKNKIIHNLKDKRIFLPNIWPEIKQINKLNLKKSKYYYNNLLALPIDQRHSISDLNLLSNEILTYAKY